MKNSFACVKFHLAEFLFLIFLNVNLYSQGTLNRGRDNEEIFVARTKQLNEFIDRFNHKSDFSGNTPDSAFLSKMPRDKMLSLLFNLKDPRTITGNPGYNTNYCSEKAEFIKEVTSKNLTIDKYSPSIIAEAMARINYKGTDRIISLYLNQERAGKGIKWVLRAAGDAFEIFSADTSMIRFIPPSSHETDFINLKRALEDTEHLPDYAYNGFKPDFLSIFIFCINTGVIRFDYVESVTYHILDIPGWYIKVDDFNRNELNSGWLISDLSKNNQGIDSFLNNLK